jgi:hypothetical protein
MKTTVEISDALFTRAKRYAQRTRKSMRAVIEEGLRRVLESEAGAPARYRLPDRSVGTVGAPDPLETLTWPALRDEVYGGR